MGTVIPPDSRRPFTAAGVDTVKEAELWRTEIMWEISEKVEQISDRNLYFMYSKFGRFCNQRIEWSNQQIDEGKETLGNEDQGIGRTGLYCLCIFYSSVWGIMQMNLMV